MRRRRGPGDVLRLAEEARGMVAVAGYSRLLGASRDENRALARLAEVARVLEVAPPPALDDVAGHEAVWSTLDRWLVGCGLRVE